MTSEDGPAWVLVECAHVGQHPSHGVVGCDFPPESGSEYCAAHRDRPGDGPARVRLFTTLAEADAVNTYELAGRWAGRTGREWDPTGPTYRAEQVDELATMASLAGWLQRWMPLQIHRALLAGASLDEVVAATDLPRWMINGLWREWVDGQLQLRTDYPNMRDISGEVAQVDAVFAAQL